MPKNPVRQSEAIWLEKSHRWSCKVTKDGTRKAFYSSTPGRKGKREAERKADEWLEEGSIHDGAKFGVIWQAFIQHELDIRGPQNDSYLQREKFGRLYILPILEYKKMEDILPIDWQNCIDLTFARSKEKGKPLSKKTLQNIRGALTSFRAYCKKNKLDLRTMEPITIPRDAPSKQHNILQPDDMLRLFSPPPGNQPHFLFAWRMQVLTGLRPGELYGLRNEDINGNVLTISRSVNVHNVVTIGKNRNAQRTFHLPAQALEVLQDQQEYLRKIGIISPYVFPARDGSIASETLAAKSWRYYNRSLGITKCSLYDLRHTLVSIAHDVPDALLKPMVGHSKNMDTRGIYGHEVRGNRERTAALVTAAIASVLNPSTDAPEPKLNPQALTNQQK